eukprot:scaffold15590_cov61-Phaeocystis_antarctica.AAC.3
MPAPAAPAAGALSPRHQRTAAASIACPSAERGAEETRPRPAMRCRAVPPPSSKPPACYRRSQPLYSAWPPCTMCALGPWPGRVWSARATIRAPAAGTPCRIAPGASYSATRPAGPRSPRRWNRRPWAGRQQSAAAAAASLRHPRGEGSSPPEPRGSP